MTSVEADRVRKAMIFCLAAAEELAAMDTNDDAVEAARAFVAAAAKLQAIHAQAKAEQGDSL